jgi:hypothetical protein
MDYDPAVSMRPHNPNLQTIISNNSANSKPYANRLWPVNQEPKGIFDEKSRVENLVTQSLLQYIVNGRLNILR